MENEEVLTIEELIDLYPTPVNDYQGLQITERRIPNASRGWSVTYYNMIQGQFVEVEITGANLADMLQEGLKSIKEQLPEPPAEEANTDDTGEDQPLLEEPSDV